MRKTNIKLLNFSLLLLLIYSCSNQEDYISNHHHSEKIKNEISFQQFLNETNVNDFSVRLKLNPASNALQRTASLNDFVIDTVAILKHIAQDNKATYSFKVEPLNTLEYSEAKSFNVIYHKISNSWEKTLISFDEIENPINNTKSFNDFDNLFSESIAMRGACFTYVEVDNCNNRCIGTCDRCTDCLQISYVAVECGVAGGGDDPYNPDLDQNPNYSGGTTGGDGSSTILEFEPNPKGGGGSLVDNPNPTPCEDLKNKSLDTNFNAKLQELDTDAANSYVETGYVTYSDSPSYPTKSYGDADIDGSYINLTWDETRASNTTGFMHCHQNATFHNNLAVFSPDDMMGFGTLIANSTANTGEFTCIVTSLKGTFAIKITDKQDYINFANYIKDNYEKVFEIFKKEIKHTMSTNDQVEALLKFIQKNSTGGVELYQKTSTNKWDKKYLDSNNEVKSIRC
jgi:hypothetical protein